MTILLFAEKATLLAAVLSGGIGIGIFLTSLLKSAKWNTTRKSVSSTFHYSIKDNECSIEVLWLHKIINYHSPLIGLGKGKILRFDNKSENIQTDGLPFILNNNVWGTNFPLWYEDNTYFKYELNENGMK